jgi:hypothetical protein
MLKACGGGTHFCRACYDGNYPVPIEDPVDKDVMEQARQCIELDRPAGVAAAIQNHEPNEAGTGTAEAEPDTAGAGPSDVDGKTVQNKKSRKKAGTASTAVEKNVNDLPDLFG